ncbi:DUF2267 domain-containing protein [Corallococcus sp. H22C18031201]|uniref:DUF2267 domain-containing protein n=1 Tax=Citreicoccus inhibens TaxID=2849499 RepID=UPI000E768211|nr:DUF2267 domain-containing protein [Citreicoccus inhibens]MBU8894281.1 DUF2267 domain-containing protein [Citreicoccus inhibens]RJS23030.1 DUF2267 domain-containing protein [Corallococcus sp. H22C18031201]
MADHREDSRPDTESGEERTETRRELTLEERRARRSQMRSSQTYAAFLKRLCERGGMSPSVAQQAAVSVLCALEQRIYSEEASDLEAQLPRRLTELLHRCERHEGEARPAKFGREEMLRWVGEDLALNPDAVEPVVRAVLDSLRHQISEGEAEDVMAQLPEDLRHLWQREI